MKVSFDFLTSRWFVSLHRNTDARPGDRSKNAYYLEFVNEKLEKNIVGGSTPLNCIQKAVVLIFT